MEKRKAPWFTTSGLMLKNCEDEYYPRGDRSRSARGITLGSRADGPKKAKEEEPSSSQI